MAGKKKVTHSATMKLLGRALKEPAFRKRLLASPKKVLEEEGFDPHDEAVQFFKTLKTGSFDKAAQKAKTKSPRDPIGKAGEV